MDDHNTTCPDPNFCYDRLIKRCYSCKRMQRGSRKETTTVFRTTSLPTQPVQVFAGNQNCSALIFGFFAFVGLVIIMAILWLVILKQRRKRRRKTGKENSQENGKCACILANEAQTNHDCEPRDNDLGQLQCPHLNAVTMITQDDVLKENIPCVAFTRSQEVITSSPHDEKCNSLFPLPATEFGATMLVTTKTIQEDILSKELP
ncbi:PREDICTED: uncharacterized protein LOC106537793 isoform X1 [Thamnophis sirtalis]|uniref:Uncharacterized protein LOC106537793 isoform X1 n=1 Tax=Thamnophis sirtalis TaxID=35019 RepID=A0A6I9X859_9SAUR|nr:PREDICTED: uncharacterized protein LOC106537793 isoform X1 [Thamnophis sirtalis]